jgi:hypothetical protein
LHALTFPTALAKEGFGEDELGGAPARHHGQGGDCHHEEDNVQNAAHDFHSFQELSAINVAQDRKAQECPHQQSGLPSLRDIRLIIEDNEALEAKGGDEWHGSAEANPREDLGKVSPDQASKRAWCAGNWEGCHLR